MRREVILEPELELDLELNQELMSRPLRHPSPMSYATENGDDNNDGSNNDDDDGPVRLLNDARVVDTTTVSATDRPNDRPNDRPFDVRAMPA